MKAKFLMHIFEKSKLVKLYPMRRILGINRGEF